MNVSSSELPSEGRPCVTVAMLGARRHYAVPRFMHEAGMLERFYTDSYVGNKPWLETILDAVPPRLAPAELRRLRGRRHPALPPAKVTSFELLGLWSAWQRWRRPRSHAATRALERETGRRFGLHVLRNGFGGSGIVIGFSGASLELFRGAKADGIRCVLEQTILPDRSRYRWMLQEIAAWPGWEPRLSRGDFETDDFAREEHEWRLADAIIAGSAFVKAGLVECGVPQEKIFVVPYGVDTRQFPATAHRGDAVSGGPLRVLFVGSVGLRKGVPYLLEALARLGPSRVQARFVGAVAIAQERLQPYRHVADFTGALPRAEMAAMYQWADVFCLPSIVEGSAAVVYEALMSGLPVITTPNAGSLVRDGIDGQLVPVRSVDALEAALNQYARDRVLLGRHGEAAAAARQRVSLERYRDDLVRVVRDQLLQ